MKKIVLILTLLSLGKTAQATNTIPSNPTSQPLRITLTSEQKQLIEKLKNQVQSHLASPQMSTLKTLGTYIQKDIFNITKSLWETSNNQLLQAQNRDVSLSTKSKHRETFALLIKFFEEINHAVEPLVQKYHSLSKDRAKTKQNDASKKSSNGSFEKKEEYYALQQNVVIPLAECKEVVDKATNLALIKLLEYLN